MRLLDRYLFSVFGTAFALVTLTFVALFTAMDLSSRIARILSLKNINTWSFMAHYYLIRLPGFLHLVLPAVSLFAAMFTVIQFQKTNELLPMITSGVSLRRLSFIFIAGAVVCAGMMAALDEFILPNLMDDIGETDDILISDRPLKSLLLTFPNRDLNVDEYDRAKRLMKGVTLTEYENNVSRRVIRAATAKWESDSKTWMLNDGTIQLYGPDGSPIIEQPTGQRPRQKTDPLPPEGLRYDPPPYPDSFQRRFSLSGRSYKFSELKVLTKKHSHVPTYRLHYNMKFASPLGPIMLLFLGLPFVAGTQHRSFYRGIGLCLLLTVAYYATTFVCLELGNGGSMDPAVAVWAPIGLFGIAGLVSFFRMKS